MITPRRTSGLSLMEMLIVIAIILLLMALIYGANSRLRDMVRRNDTQVLLENVSTSLDTYHLIFRSYPPDSYGTLNSGEALTYFLITTFNKTPDAAKDEVLGTANWNTARISPERLKVIGGKTVIVDAWGTPLYYRLELRDYPDPVDKTKITKIPKPLFYSFGPDKLDNAGTGDDIKH